MNKYQAGTTVRIECTFFDFNGEKVDPEFIKLIIYNYKYEIINTINININNKISTGQYYYDYITSKEQQQLCYEWYGEINDLPSLKRGQFTTSFI